MEPLQGRSPAFRNNASVRGLRLRTSDNGRYLITGHGRPFFYLADTAWTLFKRLDYQEAERYFRNRLDKGFTVIQAYVLRGLEVPNLHGHFPLVNRDPTKLDQGFLGNIDRLVNLANDLGLVPAMVTTMGEHVRKGKATAERFRTDEQIFTLENAFEYGRILGARYAEHCVIWLLGGDRMPSDDDIGIWDAMGRGLKAGCKGAHLVSYHSCGGYSSSVWFHNREWLDFNTIQSLHRSADPNYRYVTGDYGLKPVKPTLDMESRFENHPDGNNPHVRMDAHQAREAAYWAVFAGAAGHGYGCNDIWQMHDESKTDSTHDYSFPFIQPTTNWYVAMDFVGAFGVGYMRKLIELRPWYTMVPDQSVIAAGQGEGENHIQAARAEDGGFILAYLPFGNPVCIHMDKVSGFRVKAQWFDPRTGTFETVGEFGNAGIREFRPPTNGANNDWVLVLDDAARGYSNELPS